MAYDYLIVGAGLYGAVMAERLRAADELLALEEMHDMQLISEEEFLARNPGMRSRIAFHVRFEDYSVDELAEIFPDLADHLLAIEGNIVDLLEPFQKGWYYKKESGGSFSIKSVLPAICPDDPELDYHGLDGVHNGTEAMSVYPEIRYMPPEEQEKARKNLLAYCRLDTLAMVKVWKRAAE